MRKSLRYQTKYMLQYAGVMALVFFIMIFYLMIIRSGNSDGKYWNLLNSYQLSTWGTLLMFSLMNLSIFNSNYLSSALAFGATRKGWFKALLVSKLGFVLAGTVLLVAFRLLASVIYGQPTGDGFSFLLPALVAACLLAASLGSFLGIVSLRFGAKWMVIALILLLLLAVLAIGWVAIVRTQLVLGDFWLPAGLLAACVPVEIGGWLALRGAAVKG